MTSQVLSGSGNVSYTNNTGQNVRIIINFMSATEATGNISLGWASVTRNGGGLLAIGRNVAYTNQNTNSSNNSYSTAEGSGALPTEIMLSPGQNFIASGINAYNIVIIPEAG